MALAAARVYQRHAPRLFTKRFRNEVLPRRQPGDPRLDHTDERHVPYLFPKQFKSAP